MWDQNQSQNQNQNMYQPQDPIINRVPVSSVGHIVGTVLVFSSGRICLTIPTFGLWLDAKASPTAGTYTLVKVKQAKGNNNKRCEDPVGLLTKTEVFLPALGGVKFQVGQPQAAETTSAPSPWTPDQNPAGANEPLPF